MGIDLAVTTLWAELSTWRPPAAEVITRPEYWAVHGATRMGKAVTFDDRLEEDAIDAACLAAGVTRARAVMELLAKADRSTATWEEPAPPAVDTSADVVRAIAGDFIADVAPDGIDRLASIAHAMQAGAKLGKDATYDDVRAALEVPPRAAPRPSGPFSALLVMSMDTLWVPVALESAWDAPAFVVASSVQLRADLAALPDCLRESDPEVAGDFAAVGQLVEAFDQALEGAGSARCVVMSG